MLLIKLHVIKNILTIRVSTDESDEDGQPRVRPFGAISNFEGTLREDTRREARVAMLEDDPSLKGLASPDNGTMTVFYFESGTATIYSFTEAPKVITL